MQGNITSFKIDHNKLMPGIYLHELKETEDGFITIFDLRFKKPNMGDYLTPLETHTIEHVMATFFTQYFKDKIYFGPMGCLTGFYLVLNDMHTVDEVIKSLDKCDAFFDDLYNKNIVPAKTPLRCGNYKLLDIKRAYKVWKDFFNNKEHWGKEYPTINENQIDDEELYKNDIDVNVKLD